ncbi:hypothetical protein SKAU_G00297110 [Synaphobranchus kaupii]|uniref:5-hydroxytryptamine receptor 3A-like n=1 Tax=Synaphobranchus kaupii TaxID=118154 RepID=A0A9Q1EV05_SYNKA|nr:hypothetical protein SKAU_G00297110 [Synaphobranchus kaupii]
MKALWFVCSLALAGGVSSLDSCSYQMVNLDVYLYAILAVSEKSQTFCPFIWVSMMWKNELVSWNPQQFCGISQVAVPRELLWQPDLVIMEHIEDSNKIFLMPYIQFSHHGMVSIEDGFRVISTCKMDVYKFPFDTQSCIISFSSLIYTDSEVQLQSFSNSSWLTRGSQEYLQTQGEWDFLNISVAEGKVTLNSLQWDALKYTITIKRRPMLIVMHFLLPLLFFLILDLSSFLISDAGGEKLGFKVTVLLAISVLLLMLNDILPSSAGRTPLIATYCIVTFAFMLLSLLEAVLVKHLIERDNAAELPTDGEPHCKQEAVGGNVSSTCSADEAASCEQECGTKGLTDSQLLQLVVQELRNLRRNCPTQTAGRRETRPRYWERVALRINVAFFCLYLLAVCLFLLYLFLEWTA